MRKKRGWVAQVVGLQKTFEEDGGRIKRAMLGTKVGANTHTAVTGMFACVAGEIIGQ